MLEDYKNDVNPCIKLREEIAKLENDKIENAENQLIILKNLNKNVDEYKANVVQKLIGIEKHLEDTVRYYMADNDRRYTYNYQEISKKEYKKQLIVKPVISLLGYNINRELELATVVSIKEIPTRIEVNDKHQELILNSLSKDE